MGVCNELEAAAVSGTAEAWEPFFRRSAGCRVLSTQAILKTALSRVSRALAGYKRAVRDIAGSVQDNLARGIAALAIHAAERDGIPRVALSGGVVANRAIRETIRAEVTGAGLTLVINDEDPPGDGVSPLASASGRNAPKAGGNR